MNEIQTKTVEGDPENCFSEKEDSVFEPFFCRHHPYYYIRKGYADRHTNAMLECISEKYNLFSKLLNRKMKSPQHSVTFICRRELLFPYIMNILTDCIFYNRS